MKKLNCILIISLITAPLYGQQPKDERAIQQQRNHSKDFTLGTIGLGLAAIFLTLCQDKIKHVHANLAEIAQGFYLKTELDPIVSAHNNWHFIRNYPQVRRNIIKNNKQKYFAEECKAQGIAADFYIIPASFTVALISAGIGSWYLKHYINHVIKEKKEKAEKKHHD